MSTPCHDPQQSEGSSLLTEVLEAKRKWAAFGYPSHAIAVRILTGQRRASHHHAPAQGEWDERSSEIL